MAQPLKRDYTAGAEDPVWVYRHTPLFPLPPNRLAVRRAR